MLNRRVRCAFDALLPYYAIRQVFVKRPTEGRRFVSLVTREVTDTLSLGFSKPLKHDVSNRSQSSSPVRLRAAQSLETRSGCSDIGL